MVEKKYNEVKLSDGRVFKFHKDIPMSKIDECGDSSIPEQSKQASIKAYNNRMICAFSFDPILTEEKLKELLSKDYIKIYKDIVMSYNDYMTNFLSPSQVKKD